MNPPNTYSRIQLSEEEKRILRLIAVEGCTHDQVTLKTGKSRKTIERRLRDLREKLGVPSVYQVIAIAVKYGWISAPGSTKRFQ